MSEYLDLYEAIWVQAVEDDINKAVKELYEVALKNAYEVLIEKRKTAFYIIKNIKRIENFNSELSEYCGIRARDVEQRIKELVYRESQEWPENKDYKIRDKEYNKILTQLKEEVAEYAKEKMKRCWYKL